MNCNYIPPFDDGLGRPNAEDIQMATDRCLREVLAGHFNHYPTEEELNTVTLRHLTTEDQKPFIQVWVERKYLGRVNQNPSAPFNKMAVFIPYTQGF